MKDKLSERKQRILKAVVDEYIVNASPVSSGEIQNKYFSDISSATIRNELSALEEMGYLIQPHVSSGRIPSKLAYALYVDKFVEKQSLTKKEIKLIEETFKSRFCAIEDVVRATAKVISDVTNYTSIIVLNNDISAVVIKEVKLVKLDLHRTLVVIITDNGIIHDKIVRVNSELTDQFVSDANVFINRVFSGKAVGEVELSAEEVDNELAMFRELVESIMAILTSYANSNDSVFMEGQSKFLNSSEQSLSSTRDFLEVIDTTGKLVDIVDGVTEIGFSVKIGKDENGGIDNCAIVTANYKYNGKDLGCAGVIGPERMNYGKVISVLDYIKKVLGKFEGGGIDGKKE